MTAELDAIRESLAQQNAALRLERDALRKALADLVCVVDLHGGLGEYKGGTPFALGNAKRVLLAKQEGK